MFISDLSYLETTQSSDLVGGYRRKKGHGGKRVKIDITVIKQSAKSSAYAKAYKGNAKAVSFAVNYIG